MPRRKRAKDYYCWMVSHLTEGEMPDFEQLAWLARKERFVGKYTSICGLSVTLKLAWDRCHKYLTDRSPMSLQDFYTLQDRKQKEELSWLRAEKHILETLLKSPIKIS